jgi:hypothetical protein
MESLLLLIAVSAGYSLALLFIPEDRNDKFLRNFGLYLLTTIFWVEICVLWKAHKMRISVLIQFNLISPLNRACCQHSGTPSWFAFRSIKLKTQMVLVRSVA